MSTRRTFRNLVTDARSHYEYVAHRLSIDFALHLNRGLEKNQISRRELADKIGCSPAYITKVLRGDANFTLRSMAKLAHAVNLDLKLDVRAPESTSKSILDVDSAKGSYGAEIPYKGGFSKDIRIASAVNDDDYTSIAA